MSGHSKWKKTKYRKGVTDAARGKVFTKITKLITVAARDGGGDPDKNFKLRLVIDRARSINMPAANIDRAIKRGTGEEKGDLVKEEVFEGHGPEGVAVIVKALTDNRNRTLSELRNIFERQGGRLGESGSVMWMFDTKGTLRIPLPDGETRDDVELIAIDKGAEDIKEDDGELLITAPPKNLQQIKEAFDQEKIKINDTALDLIPKESSVVSGSEVRDKNKKLFEMLDESDDVDEIYSNLID